MQNENKTFKTKEFLYGVCYYPEHWDESMWMECIPLNFLIKL